MSLVLKRAYEDYDPSDGFRVLVDRLWPRGVPKANAHIDLWLKDIAPSTTLRKWYGHDPEKWREFKSRYFAELNENIDAVMQLARQSQRQKVTLVYGARDTEHSHARALKDFIDGGYAQSSDTVAR